MGSAPTVLIVDDEPNNIDYLEQELEGLGYQTVSARNGAEAIAIVKVTPPDLILLDVMMPVMDGFSACRLLKESEETRFIPVVMMTALDGIEDRVKGIRAGADDFLTKPVDERELMARIETSLRLKEAMDLKIGGLHRMNDHLARFVPSAVRDMIRKNPEAPNFVKQEQDVSILFIDIAGYTRLGEILSPSTLSALVERYFSVFLDEVAERQGDVNETMGDGFMAVFQSTDPILHAGRAAEAALALLSATRRLNEESQQPPIEIHIGIASGLALLGSTQFEGRHGTRWVFSASGREVNLAARLASTARAGQILVSPETRCRLGGHYVILGEGSQKLKNIEEQIEIFQLVRRS